MIYMFMNVIVHLVLQAMCIVSDLVSRGCFDELEGLVTSEVCYQFWHIHAMMLQCLQILVNIMSYSSCLQFRQHIICVLCTILLV